MGFGTGVRVEGLGVGGGVYGLCLCVYVCVCVPGSQNRSSLPEAVSLTGIRMYVKLHGTNTLLLGIHRRGRSWIRIYVKLYETNTLFVGNIRETVRDKYIICR